MPRPEKVQAVEEIRDQLQSSTATFLTEYRGLSVTQLQELRTKLRDAGGRYKVYKMTLSRRAADEVGAADLKEWMTGPTAIAFAGDDPVPVAKALTDYADTHELFVIKGGLLSGEIIPPEMVAKLATIEPRDVLLAKIAGAAKAPMVKFAGMLSSFTRDAASVFSQLLERKEAEAPAEEAPAAVEADTVDTDSAEADATQAPADEAPEASEDATAEPTDAAADSAGDSVEEPEVSDDTPAAEAEADEPQEDSTDEDTADGAADGSEEE
jgi:large subunit ribosomal protein L10